jgi:DtxR family Mn-dependent transcriptional regulator
MEIWKHFDQNVVTHSGAHYLMAVDSLLRRQGYARVSDVARFLEVTTGSASVSLKSLKQRGLVVEDNNRFLQLSEEGAALAHKIEVNRQMLVTLLSDILGVPREIAEVDACKTEHLLSDETRDKLRVFLAFVRSDAGGRLRLPEKLDKFNFECPGLEECELCEEACQFQCLDESVETA